MNDTSKCKFLHEGTGKNRASVRRPCIAVHERQWIVTGTHGVSRQMLPLNNGCRDTTQLLSASCFQSGQRCHDAALLQRFEAEGWKISRFYEVKILHPRHAKLYKGAHVAIDFQIAQKLLHLPEIPLPLGLRSKPGGTRRAARGSARRAGCR